MYAEHASVAGLRLCDAAGRPGPQEGFIICAKTLLSILNAIPVEDTEPPAAPAPTAANKPSAEPEKKKPAESGAKKKGHSKKSWPAPASPQFRTRTV